MVHGDASLWVSALVQGHYNQNASWKLRKCGALWIPGSQLLVGHTKIRLTLTARELDKALEEGSASVHQSRDFCFFRGWGCLLLAVTVILSLGFLGTFALDSCDFRRWGREVRSANSLGCVTFESAV